MNYGFKKRATLRPDNYYGVHCIFPNAEQAEEYRNWEANKSPAMKRLFNVQERLVLYLKYNYNYGRRKIRNATGISENKVSRIIYKALTISRYESQSFHKSHYRCDFNYSVKKR